MKINLFLEFDILSSQRMMINYNKKILILRCCREITISMIIISIKNKMKRVMKILKTIIILIYNNFLIFIKFREITKLFVDWDFMFIFYQQTFTRFDFDENVFSYIIDVNMCAIQMNNAIDKVIIIKKNNRLKTIQKYKKKNYYATFMKYFHLVAESSWMKKIFKINVKMLTIAIFVTFISMMFIQKFSIFISKSIFFSENII